MANKTVLNQVKIFYLSIFFTQHARVESKNDYLILIDNFTYNTSLGDAILIKGF